jgi:hypothetical protein
MAKQRIDYLKVDRLDIQETLVAGGTNVPLANLVGPSTLPDKMTKVVEYSNATTNYTDIATVEDLAPNTTYLVSFGGFFDPSYGSPNGGWQNWDFRVCDGANGALPYPNFWNGWMQANRATKLPDGVTNVNTMIPAIYGMIQGGYGLTWDADYSNLVIGITFSYTTGSTANSRTLKWQGRRNGTTVGGTLDGYDLIMIAKPVNL